MAGASKSLPLPPGSFWGRRAARRRRSHHGPGPRAPAVPRATALRDGGAAFRGRAALGPDPEVSETGSAPGGGGGGRDGD